MPCDGAWMEDRRQDSPRATLRFNRAVKLKSRCWWPRVAACGRAGRHRPPPPATALQIHKCVDDESIPRLAPVTPPSNRFQIFALIQSPLQRVEAKQHPPRPLQFSCDSRSGSGAFAAREYSIGGVAFHGVTTIKSRSISN